MKQPRWIGMAIAFYAFIAIGIAESGLGVLLPSILATYGISPADVGWLFVSQLVGYVLAALGSSLLSHRYGLAVSLGIAASSLTLALLCYALSPTWLGMVVAGTCLGLGIGLVDAGINTYIVQDPEQHHGIGTLHGFYGVGALAGPMLATTLLAEGLSWQQIYLVLAVAVGGLLVAVAGIILGRYTPMTARLPLSGGSPLKQIGRSLTTPITLLFALMLLLYVGTEASIGNWSYSVQTLARQMPSMVAGYGVAAYWLGLTLGRFGMGYLLRTLGGLRTIRLSLLGLIGAVLMWWGLPDQWLSLPLMGLMLAPIFPATIWLIPYHVSAERVPAAISVATGAASLGAAIVPSIAGWVAEQAGLGIIPVLMLPLAIALLVLLTKIQAHPTGRETSKPLIL